MIKLDVVLTATQLLALTVLVFGMVAGLILASETVITTTIITSPALLAVRSYMVNRTRTEEAKVKRVAEEP